MNADRFALVVVAGVLAVTAASAVLGVTIPGPLADGSLLEVTLWATTVLFGATATLWLLLTFVVGRGYESPPPEYGGDDVQVRILTIDAEDVVQATVDALPPELDDRHVVAERPIDVAGAEVHVVPEAFECEAVRKGRALEWARRTLDCERAFVLYLDEDSLLTEFDGLPDADVVQLREQPRRTGSYLTYLADVFRMGVQLEQRAFARMQIPLFAWGGGIAVRKDLEDAVTWDRETIVEDTAFVWAAARRYDVEFELSTVVCRNEAPPSLVEIVQQRRRWAAGNLNAVSMLPRRYRVLAWVRNFAWALSPVVTFVVVPLSLLGTTMVYGTAFVLLSLALGVLTFVWFLLGVLAYGKRDLVLVAALPLAPLVTVVHSLGTVVGVLDPPRGFRVTRKVGTRR